MKSSLRSRRQELRRVSNGVIIGPTATVDGRCADSASGGTTWLVLWHPLLRLRFFTCYLLSWRLCLMRAISNPYRQGGGLAPGADELLHPDGDGGVAGQDARRSRIRCNKE
ncbi:hypothetical protein GQ55_9G255600 [Panicum hallii var. hallii]|uniref:Uncharacterized protein n=1 Tax=Panicum hallii var. hallii TaxID=1504633 RepID=A0A2T7C6X5_9POAL|nr:hypothetical protein GQ55_9G255600 [Panicum hallii var. hallii]